MSTKVQKFCIARAVTCWQHTSVGRIEYFACLSLDLLMVEIREVSLFNQLTSVMLYTTYLTGHICIMGTINPYSITFEDYSGHLGSALWCPRYNKSFHQTKKTVKKITYQNRYVSQTTWKTFIFLKNAEVERRCQIIHPAVGHCGQWN